MKTLLPSTIASYPKRAHRGVNLVSVYDNVVRFNKSAIRAMGLKDQKLKIDLASRVAFFSFNDEGFEVEDNLAGNAKVISSRALSAVILTHFSANTRVVFDIRVATDHFIATPIIIK